MQEFKNNLDWENTSNVTGVIIQRTGSELTPNVFLKVTRVYSKAQLTCMVNAKAYI